MYLEHTNPYSITKQHNREKLHVLERIRLLFDKDSFVEVYPDTGEKKETYDGVITGYGRIFGSKVYFYGQDFTYMGGTFGYHHSKQIIAILKEAVANRKPIIGLYDGGGARIQEGAASVAGAASGAGVSSGAVVCSGSGFTSGSATGISVAPCSLIRFLLSSITFLLLCF